MHIYYNRTNSETKSLFSENYGNYVSWIQPSPSMKKDQSSQGKLVFMTCTFKISFLFNS